MKPLLRTEHHDFPLHQFGALAVEQSPLREAVKLLARPTAGLRLGKHRHGTPSPRFTRKTSLRTPVSVRPMMLSTLAATPSSTPISPSNRCSGPTCSWQRSS